MIFEYKVRARHRLGWKEFKLYADTDIEEFFNRNSIDYVRNLTDTVENKQQQEIERLQNIIKEVREYMMSELITDWDIKNDGHVSGSDLPVYAITPILEILDKENK